MPRLMFVSDSELVFGVHVALAPARVFHAEIPVTIVDFGAVAEGVNDPQTKVFRGRCADIGKAPGGFFLWTTFETGEKKDHGVFSCVAVADVCIL